MLKISYLQKENQSNHPSLQQIKMKSDVGMSPKRGLKLIDVAKSINRQIFGVFFPNRSMQGRDSCRLDLANSIQEQKYAAIVLYRF